MRINNQAAIPQKPNAANGRRQSSQRAAQNRAQRGPARTARAAAQRPAQESRQASRAGNAQPQKTLSRTAMNRKNAIAAQNAAKQPQKTGANKKAFEAYQNKLTEMIKKRDQNGDMKLSLAETGAPKAEFNKIDLNRDGFINKAEIESRVSSRINAMEEILLSDPGKLVKMMKELGPEISDKVGGKDSYKKIVKNLKILAANDRANNPQPSKSKGNVSFIA